jgi:hypothetical protein
MASVKYSSVLCFAHPQVKYPTVTPFQSSSDHGKLHRVNRMRQNPSTLSALHMTLSRNLFLSIAPFVLTQVPLIASSTDEPKTKSNLDLPVFKTTSSGLKYLDIKLGSGLSVEFGNKVTFHYVGRLAGRQGKPFEDTYADEPYRITLGKDKIIAGLEEGLIGMKEGGKRRLLIPSSLGYSDRLISKWNFHFKLVLDCFELQVNRTDSTQLWQSTATLQVS